MYIPVQPLQKKTKYNSVVIIKAWEKLFQTELRVIFGAID